MAEGPDTSLTINEITEFLNEKRQNTVCRICENREWLTGSAQEMKGFIPIGTDDQGDFRLSDRSIPVQYLICTNCGNLELISTAIIRQWKVRRSRPERPKPERDRPSTKGDEESDG